MDSIPQKQCTKCGELKPATTEHFRFEKRRQSLVAKCWECDREYSRLRRRKWREDHPEEAREKSKLEQREFRKRNAKRVSQKDKERRKKKYLENPELAREKSKAKYRKMMQANPQSLRNKGIRNNHKRRERIVANSTKEHFTTADVDLHFKTQKGKCWWCGKKLDPDNYTIDHRIAIARGGSNSASNICISCPRCNFSKHDKLPSEWNGRLL